MNNKSVEKKETPIMKKITSVTLMISLILSLAGNVFAAETEGATGYSPYVRGYPQKVLFGDTHVHTALSNDAFGAGNTLGPEDAYRFARGDEIVSSHGESVRLNQPLDFVVVADHAEAYTASSRSRPEIPK
jgi:hypothetical protein